MLHTKPVLSKRLNREGTRVPKTSIDCNETVGGHGEVTNFSCTLSRVSPV